MVRPNQSRTVPAVVRPGWVLSVMGVLSAVTLGGCLGRGAPGPATTTTVAAASAVIANLAPTTLAGGGEGLAPAETTVVAPAPTLLVNGAPAPGRGLTTPEAAARNLWDAWRDTDRPRALLYASPEATNALLGATWGPEIHRVGCTAVAKGHLCRFEGPTERWDLDVSGSDADGFRVESVTTGRPAGVDLNLLTPSDTAPAADEATPTTGPDGSPGGSAAPTDTAPAGRAPAAPTATTARRRTKRTTVTPATAAPATDPAPPVTRPQPAPGPDPIPASSPDAPAPAPAPAPVPVARPVDTVG